MGSVFRNDIIEPTLRFFSELKTKTIDSVSALGIRKGSSRVAGHGNCVTAFDVASQLGNDGVSILCDNDNESESFFDSIPVARFISEARKECSTVEWKLKDFLHLNKVHMLDPGPSITVKAGNTIDLPTKWKFSLKKLYSESETRSHIWLMAEVVDAPLGVENVVAKFATTLLVDKIKIKEIPGSPVTIRTPGRYDDAQLFNVACLIPWDCVYSSEKLLTIRIQLLLFSRKTDGSSARLNIQETMDKSANHFSLQIGSLLRADEEERKRFSDVELMLNDDVTLYAHKVILACRSPVFKAMLMSDMEETKTGVVKIPDVDSKTMGIVLHHIYTGKVDPSCNQIIGEVIYAAAKYNLPELLEYCDKIMITVCDNENAMSLLKLAKMYELRNGLKDIGNYIRTNSTEILEEIIED